MGITVQLLYSEYFHGFLCSEEQNEAVSNIKLGQYSDAAPLLETIFYVRNVEINLGFPLHYNMLK